MFHPSRLLAFALCLSTIAPTVGAQQPSGQKKKPATKKASAEVDPMMEVRRTTAISLINTLADDARMFRDPVLRARVQARAADALWETDKEKARTLFRRAWDEAETVDAEQGEQRAREASRRGAASSREAGSMRREVLKLAARRDSALGEELLARLDESMKQDASGAATAAAAASANAAGANSQGQRFNPDDPPSAMTQRLNLANQLLEDGDTVRAMQFADSALYPVNTFGMNILNMLREKDAAAADQRFAALLARAVGDPLADANTVSLLTSYVFTPFLYVTVRPDGNSHTRRFRGDNSPPANLSPALRDSFLTTAARILLRPLPQPDQDRSSSGRIGAYVVVTRLLPLFDRFAPDKSPGLRARQSQLAQDTPEQNRRPDDPLLTRGIVPEDRSRDNVADTLARLDSAKNSGERDMIYFRAAMNALERDPAQARELALKIEDVDTRKQLLAYMAFQLVRDAVRAKKPEDALRLARSEELTNVQRAWAFTEAARLLSKSQPGRAAQVLDEATTEARRIDDASHDRVRALVAVATQLVELDRPRAWELMNEVVKSSNALADFSGEDGGLTMRVEFKGGGAMTSNFDVESFDLAGIFAALAREDLDSAVTLARTLKGESPRAVATLAIARTVLVKRDERSATN
jgi:hypothetical protein